jgi:aspartate-semialdehyde dehydrogenase
LKPLRLGIIGASSLKGKEIKEALENTPLGFEDVALMDDETALGKLEAFGEEATFVQSVNDATLEELDLAFFTGEAALTRKHYDQARRANCSIVDTSYALEGEGGYPVRSPWLEEEIGAAPPLDATGAVVAHPIATALGLILHRVGQASAIKTAVATVLQPVSEAGHPGMDELHQQTVNLLNFQSLPKDVFDAQVAFNLLSSYGTGKASPLDRVRSRIASHLKTILGGAISPALMVIAAPVFHAYALSLYVETENPFTIDKIASAMQGAHIHVLDTAAEPQDLPNNVNVAGEDRIAVAIRAENTNPNAFWIWAAADNLKITALTAIDCARKIAEMRPSGQVQ